MEIILTSPTICNYLCEWYGETIEISRIRIHNDSWNHHKIDVSVNEKVITLIAWKGNNHVEFNNIGKTWHWCYKQESGMCLCTKDSYARFDSITSSGAGRG